jgi:hypothetical protein
MLRHRQLIGNQRFGAHVIHQSVCLCMCYSMSYITSWGFVRVSSQEPLDNFGCLIMGFGHQSYCSWWKLPNFGLWLPRNWDAFIASFTVSDSWRGYGSNEAMRRRKYLPQLALKFIKGSSYHHASQASPPAPMPSRPVLSLSNCTLLS